jgi:hypothetical protein
MSNQLCVHYINGNCKWGPECKKHHEDGLCRFFFVRGECRAGDTCKFGHADKCPPGLTWKSLPPRPKKPKKPKNTTDFKPSVVPADMNIKIASQGEDVCIGSRDLLIAKDVFSDDKQHLMAKLTQELEDVEATDPNLFKLWHGDTHYIADDKMHWKTKCPTFGKIVDQMAAYYGMEVKATRLNWYKGGEDWKPFHHDAAAVKADKAATQNFTMAASFGATRDVAFQWASVRKDKQSPVISLRMQDCDSYAFAKDVNILWKHGIPQGKRTEGKYPRISIILWGWRDMTDVVAKKSPPVPPAPPPSPTNACDSMEIDTVAPVDLFVDQPIETPAEGEMSHASWGDGD